MSHHNNHGKKKCQPFDFSARRPALAPEPWFFGAVEAANGAGTGGYLDFPLLVLLD